MPDEDVYRNIETKMSVGIDAMMTSGSPSELIKMTQLILKSNFLKTRIKDQSLEKLQVRVKNEFDDDMSYKMVRIIYETFVNQDSRTVMKHFVVENELLMKTLWDKVEIAGDKKLLGSVKGLFVGMHAGYLIGEE